MDQLSHVATIIALTMGTAWASGINLYAAVLMLGIMGMSGGVQLPPDLQILAHPAVLLAAGFMYVVQFVADKIPGVDTGWDTLHTFVRIPAGAVLAAGAAGAVDPSLSLAAALVGGVWLLFPTQPNQEPGSSSTPPRALQQLGRLGERGRHGRGRTVDGSEPSLPFPGPLRVLHCPHDLAFAQNLEWREKGLPFYLQPVPQQGTYAPSTPTPGIKKGHPVLGWPSFP